MTDKTQSGNNLWKAIRVLERDAAKETLKEVATYVNVLVAKEDREEAMKHIEELAFIMNITLDGE